jgi:hypothetical protein
MSEPVNSPCFFQRKNVSSAAPHRAAVVLRAPRGNALPPRGLAQGKHPGGGPSDVNVGL